MHGKVLQAGEGPKSHDITAVLLMIFPALPDTLVEGQIKVFSRIRGLQGKDGALTMSFKIWGKFVLREEVPENWQFVPDRAFWE